MASLRKIDFLSVLGAGVLAGGILLLGDFLLGVILGSEGIAVNPPWALHAAMIVPGTLLAIGLAFVWRRRRKV